MKPTPGRISIDAQLAEASLVANKQRQKGRSSISDAMSSSTNQEEMAASIIEVEMKNFEYRLQNRLCLEIVQQKSPATKFVASPPPPK